MDEPPRNGAEGAPANPALPPGSAPTPAPAPAPAPVDVQVAGDRMRAFIARLEPCPAHIADAHRQLVRLSAGFGVLLTAMELPGSYKHPRDGAHVLLTLLRKEFDNVVATLAP